MFFKIFSTVLLKVGLKSAKIFEVGDHNDNGIAAEKLRDDEGAENSLSSPNSSSKEKERKKEKNEPTESSSSTFNTFGLSTATMSAAPPPYPPNRSPSIRSFNTSNSQTSRNPTSLAASDLIFPNDSSAQPIPLPHPY